MARLPRFYLPGISQHIIIRSLNRQTIFNSYADYRYYQMRLCQSLERHQCALHAYVLMPDHVQLLVTPRTRTGISKMVQMLGRHYVQYFNNTYKRSGTIWDGRYRAAPVECYKYLMCCYRFIDTYPVMSGTTSEASGYEWSSYRYNALRNDDVLVTAHDVYINLGQNDVECANVYRGLCGCPLPVDVVAEINSSIYKGWVLGSDGFKRYIEQRLCRRASPLPRGGDRKSNSYRRVRLRHPDT